MSPPFQNVTFDKKKFIIMRDDLSHPIFSGNKARKLAYIIDHLDRYSHIETIISFGGNQSNFMLTLSQLAKLMSWKFKYWIKPLPKFLKGNFNGNLKLAIENGMDLIETSKNLCLENIKRDVSFQALPHFVSQSSSYKSLSGIEMKKELNNKNNILFFDQGGCNSNADIGIKKCAFEIKKYCGINNIDNYSVVVASGTGITALYLEKYLPNKIYTIACVCDNLYSLKQMSGIDLKLKKPKILTKNFNSNFGHLDIINYEIYQKLLIETNVEFDLLYDPISWRVLLKEYDNLPKPIIYIHCGGISGNSSMLQRYQRMIKSFMI